MYSYSIFKFSQEFGHDKGGLVFWEATAPAAGF